MEPGNNQPPVVISTHCYQEPEHTRGRSNPSADTFEHDVVAAKDTIENADGLEIQSADGDQVHSTRKCGRPRLDAPGAAVLSQERRVQVRRAQKTYRLKKEATLQSYKTHIVELERKIEKIAELVSECNNIAIKSDVQIVHSELFMRLQEIRRHLAPELEGPSQNSTYESPRNSISSDKGTVKAKDKGDHSESSLIFGYQVSGKSSDKSPEQPLAHEHTQSREARVKRRCLSGPMNKEDIKRTALPEFRNTERLFGQRVPITHSFHVTVFSRRLHRYSLEHAYRLFIDPGADPTAVYQVFRLVPCIRDKMKMSPYFKKLIHVGIKDPLELPTLPFYCFWGSRNTLPAQEY